MAIIPTNELRSAAAMRVLRFPNVSSRKNVETNVPTTAPIVFAAYSMDTPSRPASPADSTARDAAGRGPPIRTVGTISTRTDSTSRTIVARNDPIANDPPIDR